MPGMACCWCIRHFGYGWKDWPDYNRTLVGGGARSHDKYGEFEVTVKVPDHPVMADASPRQFKNRG